MATEYATDVDMQSFDFSSFLREATAQRTLFPIIAGQGPVEPVLTSRNSLGIYGESAVDNMIAALKTAHNVGNHWTVRVVAGDSRYSACIVGIFAEGAEGAPFLGIAPLKAIANAELSPVYQNGGLPLELNKFKIGDALSEGGTDLFIPNNLTPEGSNFYQLLEPLALIYRNGTGTEGDQYEISIISDNAAPIAPVKAATVIQGGNLRAGTYAYTRVPVTAKGEQPESSSEVLIVTITAADVTAGRRAIKLNWDIDDIAVRGVMIYREFTPAGGGTATMGRLAELQRIRLSATDDTFNIPEASFDDNTSTRVELEQNFMLEISKDGNVLDNLAFSFNIETEAYSAAPIDEAINLGTNYLKCIRLYETPLKQEVGTFICYSTPSVPLAGGFNGSDTPNDDDLERALEPFLNRDRYRVSAIVDLGWCSPTSADQFAKVEAAQRAHTLLSVPYGAQTAQGAVAYAASLTSGSRRSSIYTPWMFRRDTDTNSKRLIPPAAFAAQCMHQSDAATSGGAGRSFAGLNRGYTDAIGVENPDKYEYTDPERDLMARGLVNYFRRRPSMGMVLWEDWTLQRNITAASYVNVSRLWDIIQNAINDYLEYKLKEPNDSYNTTEIVAGLNEYLKEQVRVRNLGDFKVVADGRAGNNNTTADQGIRNIDIYLTPVIAVRRFRCRTILTRQGANYEELMQAI